MKNATTGLLLALTLGFTQIASANAGVDFFRLGVPKDRVPGVAIVKLHGIDAHHLVVDGKPLHALSSRTGVDVSLIRPVALGWAFVEIRAHGVKAIPNEAQTLALINKLATDASVEAISADKWMRPMRVPNDPGLSQMWHFDIIHAQQAWDTTVGDASQRIGIVDTGILRAHEDVGNRAVAGFDFISNPGTANDGDGRDADFNDAGDSCQGQPSSFHGTHVAGTIGATANNGTGVVGLNWNAGLVIARALGVCGGDLVDIAEGAIWLSGGHVDNVPDNTANKVSVINLSLGSDSQCSSFEQQAVDFANSANVAFVAAAGNSGFQNGQQNSVGSPANCNGAIAVGAHGPQRELAGYSSFGPEVAIVAPGGDEENFGQGGGVLSTIGPVSNGYTFDEGTSMATPHVTGSISLMQALNPTLTRSQIVQILQQTGAACTGCGSKVALVLDAALAAVPAPTSQPPPPPPPPPTSQDDAFEENDSFDAAVGGLQCNTTVNLVALPADQDWFLLPTSAGESIDVAIASQNGADLDLYALTAPSNDAIIAQSNGNTGNEQIHVDADGTTLHLLVDPYVDTQNNIQNTGPYTLTLTCSGTTPPPSNPPPSTDPPPSNPPPSNPPPAGDDDAFEPNNSIDVATEMFCDQELDNLVSHDDDFYSLDVRDGDTLAANVTGAVTTSILSATGAVLASGDAHKAASASDLAAGTYVVKVSPSGAGGSYQLKAKCSGAVGSATPSAAAHGGCSAGGGAPAVFALLAVALVRRRRR